MSSVGKGGWGGVSASHQFRSMYEKRMCTQAWGLKTEREPTEVQISCLYFDRGSFLPFLKPIFLFSFLHFSLNASERWRRLTGHTEQEALERRLFTDSIKEPT